MFISITGETVLAYFLLKSNIPQQADRACLSLFFASSPQGAGYLHPKGAYPRGCLHSVSVHASYAPLAHSTIKYPWKHFHVPKCPLGTLLAGIKIIKTTYIRSNLSEYLAPEAPRPVHCLVTAISHQLWLSVRSATATIPLHCFSQVIS